MTETSPQKRVSRRHSGGTLVESRAIVGHKARMIARRGEQNLRRPNWARDIEGSLAELRRIKDGTKYPGRKLRALAHKRYEESLP